jgi:hypothetical protein
MLSEKKKVSVYKPHGGFENLISTVQDLTGIWKFKWKVKSF